MVGKIVEEAPLHALLDPHVVVIKKKRKTKRRKTDSKDENTKTILTAGEAARWLWHDLFDARQPIESAKLFTQDRPRFFDREAIGKLLYINQFIEAIVNSFELAYQFDETKEESSRWKELTLARYQRVLGYSSFIGAHLALISTEYLIRDHGEQNEYLPIYLNEITQVFFSVYEAIGIESGLREVALANSLVNLYKCVDATVCGTEKICQIYSIEERAEVLNDLIHGIRKQMNEPDPNYRYKPGSELKAKPAPSIKETYKRRREKIQKRFWETKAYVRGIIDRFGEVQIVNIDFGYRLQSEEMNQGKTKVTPVPIERAYSDLKKLQNNERRNSTLFGDMVGYVWRYNVNAYGLQEFHCLFFYKVLGSRSVEDLAKRIGGYWNTTITNDKGSYIACEKIQRPDITLGFNLIWKDDSKKWESLVRHLYYMTAKELYFQVGNIPRGTHVVGHSRR